MKFEYQEQEYIVKFGYYSSKRKKLVECVIYTKEQGYNNPLIREIIDYPDEYFNKKKARNIVLKQALLNHAEDFRMSVWDAYFQESNIYPRHKKYKNNEGN